MSGPGHQNLAKNLALPNKRGIEHSLHPINHTIPTAVSQDSQPVTLKFLKAQTVDDYEKLLPWNLHPSNLVQDPSH